MIETIKQLIQLIKKSEKLWLLPIFLLLIIAVLFIIAAQSAPVPIFIYPLI